MGIGRNGSGSVRVNNFKKFLKKKVVQCLSCVC